MTVVFEDENFSFGRQDSQIDRYGGAIPRKVSVAKQISMSGIIVLCIYGAYVVPKLMNGSQNKNVVYREDITEARMRLVPEKDRDAFISKFPSREKTGQ